MNAPETNEELLQMRCDHLVERNGLLRHVLSEIRRISSPEPDSCVHQYIILHQVLPMAAFKQLYGPNMDVSNIPTFRFCPECRHIEGPE